MSIFTIDRKQKIDDDFLYWYKKSKEAVDKQEFLTEESISNFYVVVNKYNDDYDVKILAIYKDQKPLELKGSTLIFKIPENLFDNDEVHYLLLQAWLTSKLTHWYKVSGRRMK